MEDEIVSQLRCLTVIELALYCGKKAGIKVGAASQPIKPAQGRQG
jgi:hypothetical protein